MINPSADKIAVIAGGGLLPALLVRACQSQDRPYAVIGLRGHADTLQEEPDLWANLGDAGRIFATLRNLNVAAVVMAGKVKRPNLYDLKPDWRTIKFLARTGVAAFTNQKSVGDDLLLRSVIAEIEREGLKVIGVEEILSDLLVHPGIITRAVPGPADDADISTGLESALLLGAEDLGQAVTVQGGRVLATEDHTGTDALIERSAHLKEAGPGPILVKVSKPQQDRRSDLPAIGIDTVQHCVAAGFRGIAFEAGATLVLEREVMVAEADRAGMWIIAVQVPETLSGAQ
jgi:DUF1009 family protein